MQVEVVVKCLQTILVGVTSMVLEILPPCCLKKLNLALVINQN